MWVVTLRSNRKATSAQRDQPVFRVERERSSTLPDLHAHDASGDFFSGREWERPFGRHLLNQKLPLKVELNWKQNFGAGATPGIWLQATNRDLVTVERASVVITNVMRYQELADTGEFVTSPDVHGAGTTFTEVQIDSAKTLHPGVAESVGFIRYETSRLDIQGVRQENVRMTLPGIRRLTVRVRGADGREIISGICFRWEGPGKGWPEPCPCPQSRVPV